MAPQSDEQKKVIIVSANTLDRETRATKIIRTLTKYNYNVTFLCWDRGKINTLRSERNEAGTGFSEIKFNLYAPWGITSIFFLPAWWSFIFYYLMTNDWDIVHAIQITTSPPAIIAGKLRRKSVIYDMLDTYEDSIIIPKFIRNFFVFVDKIFLKLSKAVILADEEQIDELNGIPNNKIVTIYDSPDTTREITHKKKNNKIFTIFFAGLLYTGKHLNLDKMIEAIQTVDRVKLIIAGHGDLVPEIQKAASTQPDKIEFIGEIPHSEVLQRSSDADLLFVLRDPLLPVNKYICGSKILESMMCGTPILVSRGTSTAKKVNEEQCGVIVNGKDIYEIREALFTLINNKSLCEKFGNNARNAYETKYSWKNMEKKLLELYDSLNAT